MKKTILTCCLAAALALSSCFTNSRMSDAYEERLPAPVAFSVKEPSALFNDKNFKLYLDSLDHVLRLNLEIRNGLRDFPFPKDKAGQQLTAACIRFELYCNGQLIRGANLPVYARNQRVYYMYGYNQWLGDTLGFASDTIDLKTTPSLTYEVPYFAFSKVKPGVKEIELRIFQEGFYSAISYRVGRRDSSSADSVFSYVRNKSPLSLLKAKVAFKLNVPPIYKTGLCNEMIELRDDSTYSPSGSDHTIWNSSYPDLYWTIDHPLEKNYVRSDYEKSTAQYTRRDTFYVFHYSMNDSIDINIWDHDNLSKDDFIANGRFAMSQFRPGKTNRFSFGPVRRAEIKALSFGVINK